MVAARRKNQRRFFETLRFIQRINAVDGALELPGKAVIINWRSQHDHLCLIQQRINLLHIVFLDTLAFMAGFFLMAIFAGHASGNLLLADIYHIYLMAVFPCALCKSSHYSDSIPFWARAAVKNKELPSALALH